MYLDDKVKAATGLVVGGAVAFTLWKMGIGNLAAEGTYGRQIIDSGRVIQVMPAMGEYVRMNLLVLGLGGGITGFFTYLGLDKWCR